MQGPDISRVEYLIRELKQSSDAVQVLITWTDDVGTTQYMFSGGGNEFTRLGMAHTYLNSTDAEYLEFDDDDEEDVLA